MRFLFRWTFRFFLIAVILLVALVLLKDVLLKSLAEKRIRYKTGLHAKITRLELSLLSPTLTIEGLRVFNPAELGGSPFLQAPELHLEWDPRALRFGELRLRLARIHLTEINIAEPQGGRTSFMSVLDTGEAMVGTAARQAFPRFGLKFSGIDTLNLTIGRVRHTVLGPPNQTTEYDLNLRNAIFLDVNSVSELSNRIINALLKNGITVAERTEAWTGVLPQPQKQGAGRAPRTRC